MGNMYLRVSKKNVQLEDIYRNLAHARRRKNI